MDSFAIVDVVRMRGGTIETCADSLAVEEPLEIRVRGRAITITMRTPGHDAELAVGFLCSEGIVHRADDIAEIRPCDANDDGNLLNVTLAPEVYVDFDRLTRHVFASSSCGLCGKATIDAIRQTLPPIDSDVSISAQTLSGLPDVMRDAQENFERTGGLHAAGLFDADGKMLVLREDVGRHNVVDKAIGHALLNSVEPQRACVLLVSGRTSFEILQKALAARVAIIASVSAPSSLAVAFAKESGQTLVGFLRPGRMNIYTHPRRIRFENDR